MHRTTLATAEKYCHKSFKAECFAVGMKDTKTVQEHPALDLDEAVELARASCQETQEAIKLKLWLSLTE